MIFIHEYHLSILENKCISSVSKLNHTITNYHKRALKKTKYIVN